MKLVIIESPHAGDIVRNRAYAFNCMRNSLYKGEAPLASHLLYTQFLDDKIPDHRKLGIEAGLAWRRVADLAVFYIDLGWSPGMIAAKNIYDLEGFPYEERTLGGYKLG